MERENVLYKIEGSLVFNTGAKGNSIVTEKLGIQPMWSWNKNDTYLVKRINETRCHPNGIWGYKTKPAFVDTADISTIIQHLRELLSDKVEIVNELVNEYQFECNINITVYSEEEGLYGTSIDKDDLLFLSHFPRFDISFLQVENVEE